MELLGSVKNYEWGKLGSNSEVAQLAALNDSNFTVEESKPYSELWMGSHVNGPSLLKATGEELGSVLPQPLPFLFKVLSIDTSLSIQVHPNKDQALRLHTLQPDVYKDANHKPELAIALTPFVALCGFRPYEEIHRFCTSLLPLGALLGGPHVLKQLQNGSATDLRNVYRKLLTSNPNDVASCIEAITINFSSVLDAHKISEIFYGLSRDYPNDAGVLSLFFLNVVHLKPREAIFLGANEIHAYLSGDCVECMACSDNVIRAGLTPKFKDVEQLIICLNFKGQPASTKIFQPEALDECVRLFSPPVDDFAVLELVFPLTISSYQLELRAHAAILIVLRGEAKLKMTAKTELTLTRGSIAYIPAEESAPLEFTLKADRTEEFVAYLATSNYFKQNERPKQLKR